FQNITCTFPIFVLPELCLRQICTTAEVKNPTWRSRGSNPGLSVTRRIGAPSLAVPAHVRHRLGRLGPPFASALGSPQPAPPPAPGIKHYALRHQHRSYAVYPHYDQGTRQCKVTFFLLNEGL
ncbi:hypothetical protein EJB05_28034, partial [Eragrostis curvula]